MLSSAFRLLAVPFGMEVEVPLGVPPTAGTAIGMLEGGVEG